MSVRGLLQITLKSANDLHKHDLFGKQQPYCQVDCGNYRVKGKTCKDGGQNPTWGETLFFQVSSESDVHISIFAEHQLSKDSPIGTAVIPIVQVRHSGSEDVSVPVMHKGKQAGTLHVALEFKGATVSSFGQLGGSAYGQMTSGDAAARAHSGGRSAMFGAGPSFSSGSSGSSQARLASMPIRLLQQHGSSLMHAQQQSPSQPPTFQPFGPGMLQTSQSMIQPPVAQQQDPSLEARELLLQRQLSAPVLPADMAAVQQLYSQHVQQLQLLQSQLLGNLPAEVQQQQQQQLLRQQQVIAQAAQRMAAGQQQQQDAGGQQQGGSSAAGRRGLQLPKQPRKTAADLFRPDSSGLGGSSGIPSVMPGDVLSGSELMDDSLLGECEALFSSGASSVPFSFDNVARLQAIIAKVYPEHNLSSIAEDSNHSRTHPEADSQAPGQLVLSATAASVAVQEPSFPQGDNKIQPSSIGVFGAAGTLAAYAATADASAPAFTDDMVSGMGGFAGAAGFAAAAAAAVSSPAGISPVAATAPPHSDGGRSTGSDLQLLTSHTSSTSDHRLQVSSVQAVVSQAVNLESVGSGTSAQSAPAILPLSAKDNAAASSSSKALPQVLSAPASGPLPVAAAAVTPAAAAGPDQQQQQQQVALSPDVAAVLADELMKLKLAAPVLAQVLGLGAAPAWHGSTAAAAAAASLSPEPSIPSPVVGTPEAAAAAWLGAGSSLTSRSASSMSRAGSGTSRAGSGAARTGSGGSTGAARTVDELERLLAAADKDKAFLTSQLQERDSQLQQMYRQLTAQHQELQVLQHRLAQLQPESTQQQQQQQQQPPPHH